MCHKGWTLFFNSAILELCHGDWGLCGLNLCLCLYGYMHVSADEDSMKARGVRCPGVGVACGCELPDMGAGNQTWVHCESSVGS